MTATTEEALGPTAFQSGAYNPVRQEVTSEDLRITGAIPEYLDGRYLRNGSNPVAEVDPQTYHIFSGDAMVHGISLRDGKAQWYRNRWVRTPVVSQTLGEPTTATIKARAGTNIVGPNTNVLSYAGRTLALVEGGQANYELTDELDTIGTCDFDGTLSGGYTAHPKIDPDTGEMHAVSYSFARGNTVQYSVIGTDGRARRTVDIQVRGAPFMHEFTLTDKYVVLYDLPVTLNPSLAVKSMSLPRPLRKPAELVLQALVGKVKIPNSMAAVTGRLSGVAPSVPYSWNPHYPARVGVMPRDGSNADVRWFEIEPCCVLHAVNGYSETRGGSEVVVIDLVRHDSMFKMDARTPNDETPALSRWTIDLTRGDVRMEPLDDRWLEFPRINETFLGKKHRYGYLPNLRGLLGGDNTDRADHQLIKVDYATGTTQATDLDHVLQFGEMSFIPNPSAKTEDDGVLIGYVTDLQLDEGQLLILDAPTLEPMATVHLPQRVPAGWHGNWAPRP